MMQNRCIAATGMRLLPYSQSCQVRRVEWMRLAAAVCDSPATSRAPRLGANGAGRCCRRSA